MFKSKYSNLLTILLVVSIIAIIVIFSVIIVRIYMKNKNDKDVIQAISDFDSTISNNTNVPDEDLNITNEDFTVSNTSGSTGGTRRVKYYKEYVMIGYIKIPKISLEYPILETETVSSLETSVAVRYPSNPKLNEKGNTVIAGHNYRNGMFFSNLKKVSTGDKITITDGTGKTLTYTIYEIYETTPEDVGYITRDVGDNIEVTLVTCTDNSKARLIVLAKV